ncbi:MAG: hypothetical protein AAF376_03275 [Pseudomonadota bacterium]
MKPILLTAAIVLASLLGVVAMAASQPQDVTKVTPERLAEFQATAPGSST